MKIIGHRGARGLAPENTIAALKIGLNHSVDGLEFDLRVTKDNVAILHHDAFVDSPNGQQLLISATNFADLKKHKPDLATFAEALDTIGTRCFIYVEVKSGVNIEPITAELKNRFDNKTLKENVALGSFSQKILVELRRALPDIQLIVIESWSGVRAAWRARQVDAKIISMNKNWLWSGYIKAVSRRYTLYTFTLNSPAKARKWAKWGLAGVVTDYPDRFSSS